MFRFIHYLSSALLLYAICFVTANAQTTLQDRPLPVLPAQGRGVTVLFFLRSDCPVSNSYAPEIERLTKAYPGVLIHFWLVYPDVSDATAAVEENLRQYYAGTDLRSVSVRDPQHTLVKAAGVDMMPEAAVFRGNEIWYHGRIDNRVSGLGKYREAATEHDLADAITAALAGKVAHPAGGPAYGCYIADAR